MSEQAVGTAPNPPKADTKAKKKFRRLAPPPVLKKYENYVVFGLQAICLALVVFVPGGISTFVCLAALVFAAWIGQKPNPKSLAMALFIAIFIIGVMTHTKEQGSHFHFAGLVGVLVMLVQTKEASKLIKIVFGLAIVLVAIPMAGFKDTFFLELGIQIGIYAAMALGLNVVVGQAGLLDLGYAAFFAIGAYTWAIFGSTQAAAFMAGTFPLPGDYMYLFMVVAIGATAITGIIIGLPALRLRGDYLAIVTLGLGEVVRVLANNLDHPVNLTNGPKGITPVSRPDIDWFEALFNFFGLHLDKRTDYQMFFYLLVIVIIVGVVAVNFNLNRSRFGRAWIAIREDETAAKAMGIPMVKTKLIAFATGAAFSGAMGVIFAAQRTFVSPETFTLLASTTILGMVVLGGMGSIPGVILGASALTILNLDWLKLFSEQLNSWRTSNVNILNIDLGFNLADLPSQLDPAKFERLVFGVILVLMMIFRPEGLLPEKRHQAELERTPEDLKEAAATDGAGQDFVAVEDLPPHAIKTDDVASAAQSSKSRNIAETNSPLRRAKKNKKGGES